jgi:hypothetical protein
MAHTADLRNAFYGGGNSADAENGVLAGLNSQLLSIADLQVQAGPYASSLARYTRACFESQRVSTTRTTVLSVFDSYMFGGKHQTAKQQLGTIVNGAANSIEENAAWGCTAPGDPNSAWTTTGTRDANGPEGHRLVLTAGQTATLTAQTFDGASVYYGTGTGSIEYRSNGVLIGSAHSTASGHKVDFAAAPSAQTILITATGGTVNLYQHLGHKGTKNGGLIWLGRGKNGHTIEAHDAIKANGVAQAALINPDLFVFGLGHVDTPTGYALLDGVLAAYRAAMPTTSFCLVIGPKVGTEGFRPTANHLQWVRLVKTLALKYNAYVLDTYGLMGDVNALGLTVDTLHLNTAGDPMYGHVLKQSAVYNPPNV